MGGDSQHEELSRYGHGQEAPHTSGYIHPVILEICRRRGLRRVLDLGCGNGALCRCLADAGCSVVGLEPSTSGIAVARRLVPEGVFYEKSVYDPPSDIAESDFDLVVSTEVIEHLFRPSALCTFAASKLRTSGLFVLSTPYHGYLKNLALAIANKWDDHHTPCWEGGHIKFWSKKTLSRLLKSHGFQLLEFHGAGRFPWLWKTMVLVAQKVP